MLSNITKNRSFGFFVSVGVAVLVIVTAIVYAGCYHNLPRFMSWPAFIVMLVAGVVALGCLVFNMRILDNVATYLLLASSLVGLCFFIHALYNYVAVVAVGIDLDKFDPEFIACCVFFALSFVASIANFFFPMTKKEAVEE